MIQLPEHTKNGLVVLSPTRVGLGTRCLRKHTLADTISYLPNDHEDGAALEFGTRMHKAVALYWESNEAGVGSEYLRWLGDWPLNAKHTLSLALSCYASYVHNAKPMPYAQSDEVWHIEALEERAILAVIPGLELSFQLDRLVRCQERLALFDLKTAARCDARWAKQWPRDLQMKLYAEAVWRKYGIELSWLVVEGLSKDNASLNLVVLPDFSAEMRAEAWRDLMWVAKADSALLEACRLPDGTIDADRLLHRALVETPHSPSECFTYGSECPYLRLCDAEPNERVSLFKAEYKYHEPDWY